jgi:hypothetical protein
MEKFDLKNVKSYLDFAEKIGTNETLILHGIMMCLQKNDENVECIYNRFWYHSSFENMHNDLFRFCSINTLKRAVENLRKNDLIEIRNFNNGKRHKMNYYTINYERVESLVQSNIDEHRSNQNTTPERFTENVIEKTTATSCDNSSTIMPNLDDELNDMLSKSNGSFEDDSFFDGVDLDDL